MSQAFSTPVSGVTKFGELYGVIANALNSVRSCFAGAAFPSSPVQGQACFRTDTLRFYIYSGSTWVDFTDYLPVFKAVKSEVESARGLAASLDSRLNVAINRDGTLKGDAPASSWWTDEADGVAYVNASSFTVVGDKTAIYTVNRAVSLEQTTDAVGRVTEAVYASGTGLTTVTVDCAVDAGLTGVAYGQPVDNYPAHQHGAGDLTSLPEHQHGASDLTSLPTHQHGAADLTSLPSHTHGGADLTDLTGHLAGTGTAVTAAKSDHSHSAVTAYERWASGTMIASVAGWNNRTLNYLVDPGGLASVSSGFLVLPAGKYMLFAKATAYGSMGWDYYLRLWNVSAGAQIGHHGITRYHSAAIGDTPLFVESPVELSTTSTIALQEYAHAANAAGLGYGLSIAGVYEVYATLTAMKIG